MSIQGKRIILGSYPLAWSYATLRDHHFGTVHWDQVPLFVSNKVIAALSLRPLALVFGNRRAAKTDSSNKFHS